MSLVTICVPAYRSGPLLARTLRSLLDQTVADLVIDIGLEPVEAEATIAACGPLLDDPRVRLTVNEKALGFAGNVRRLFSRVGSPLFLCCPHDDQLHPRHVELLLAAIESRADASVAYSDAWLVGSRSGATGLELPDAGLEDRLFAYLVPGRMASCWRGLSRQRVLERPFPDNEFEGFSTEYEWALHLVSEGAALHVRRPLVIKDIRMAGDGSVAGGWKFGHDTSWLQAALEHHRSALVAGLPLDRIPVARHAALRIAAELAALTRWMDYSHGRFGLTPALCARLDEMEREAADSSDPEAPRLLRNAQLIRARQAMTDADRPTADRLLREIVAEDPGHVHARVLLGWNLHATGQPHEALEFALQAAALEPFSAEALELASTVSKRF